MTTTDTSPAPPAAHAIDGDLSSVDDFDAWMPIAREAYRRLADAFGALDPGDWARPTPCEGWTIRDMGGHLVGAMRSAATLRETMSQQRAFKARARATGEQEVDAMTAIQIERAADLTPEQVVAEMRSLVEPAVRGRAKMPRFLRRRAGFHVAMGTIDERWNLDYFLGCILTRDAWLHQIDLADSLGTEPRLDDHDRTIVGDVAVEWARRHGQAVELELTGPAGGFLATGTGGPELVVDAVEFCRVVSGRSSHPHPLLAQAVPF